MSNHLRYAPESLALGCWPQGNSNQGFFVFQAVSASKTLLKLKVITRTPEQAKRVFARMYRVEPRQVVIWYSYPLQS